MSRLRELAELDAWQPLQAALEDWDVLDGETRRRRLATVLGRMDYERGGGAIMLAGSVAGRGVHINCDAGSGSDAVRAPTCPAR